MINSHWYRGEDGCSFKGCGRPEAEHVQSCGEWMAPIHVFRLKTSWPAFCGKCGKHWRHSTHWMISPDHRRLYGWPHLREAVCRAKDRIMRSPRCRAFSPRLRLPCLRAMTHSCAGECDRHHERNG